MDESLRHDLCEGVAMLSAQIVEDTTPTITKEWQRRANAELLSNCELFLECRDDPTLPLDDLHTLLQRQTEVVSAVADEENTSRQMLTLLSDMIKAVSDQEEAINRLKEERTGAEQVAAEISLDLRGQYDEIVKLKRRYDSAEEQLADVQDTVKGLRRELKLRQRQIIAKEATIRELRQRLAQSEKEQHSAKKERLMATSLGCKSQQEREKRFAEIRSMLNRSTDNHVPVTQVSIKRLNNSRLQALREVRDSRLGAMRDLLQNGYKKSSSTKLVRGSSASATSEETFTDLSSLGSLSEGDHHRNRLFDELQRQRDMIR